MTRDDHRAQNEQQIGWNEESKKVLDACGPHIISFITPSAGDVYKLMKAGVKYKDANSTDGGKLFEFLKTHFLKGWTITSDRVLYDRASNHSEEKKDVLVYNMGLGPELERRILSDLRPSDPNNTSIYLYGDYAKMAELALQDLFDTNDDKYEIRKTIEPYIHSVPWAEHQNAMLLRCNEPGERVVSLGHDNRTKSFKINADFPVAKPAMSLRIARSKSQQYT